MTTLFPEDGEDATHTVFDLIKGELGIVDWANKGQVKKDIENKVMRFLKLRLSRHEAKAKAKELVNILKVNKDA